MKKSLALWVMILVLAAPIFAGVVKKTKTEVAFKGFGQFTSFQTEKLTSEQKWTDSKNEFKGKGLLGGLAGKTILKPGEMGEIIDLPAMSIFRLDHKKKEYTLSPFEKLSQETTGEEPEPEEEPAEAAESDIKIIRSEFKVEDTGETSVVNNFSVRKYIVTWVVDWENVRTGEKGTNQLSTLVWTTPMTDILQKAQEEEMKFSEEYLKKIGMDTEKIQQDILGTNWLSLLETLSQKRGKTDHDLSKFAEEMKKIKGYPVVIDGKYFVTSEKPKTEAVEEQPKDVKGMFGGLAKKMLKKKPSEEEKSQEPSLSYHIELVEVSLADLGAGDFQVPAGYKKKG